MRKNIVSIAVAALLVSSTGAFAARTLIHACMEGYYENGTRISDALDGRSFDFGVIEAGELPFWEVTEKAWWDEEKNQTEITYTVFNDAISEPIASLHIFSKIKPASISSSPSGWTGFVNDDGEYGWSTDDADEYGITMTQSLNTMTVVFSGLRNITYVPVAYDLASGTIVDNPNWVVSTVAPAPGAVVLCAMGLGLIGWIKRRFA